MSVTVRRGRDDRAVGSKVQNGSVTLTSSETRFAFRAAATVGGGSAGFDLVYDPTGRIGQATLTATASRVSLADLTTLLGFDLGLRDAVGDIDLRLRGGGRNTRDALNSASGSIEVAVAKGLWPRRPARRLAGRDAAPAGRRRHRRAVQLHRRPLRGERRRRLRCAGWWSTRRARPWSAAAISAAHRGLGVHPGARGARQPERRPRLAAAAQGRQRPRDGGRARAQPRHA